MTVPWPKASNAVGRLPDFLVVGAARAGTTSLYYYLREHPSVFVPAVKEPNFFALEGLVADFRDPSSTLTVNTWSVTRLDQYRALFAAAGPGVVCGECSPFYLYSDRAPRAIRRHAPDMKLIAVLRNPIDRAFSSYMYFRNNGIEPLGDFRAALDAEDRRIAEGWWFFWHYKRAGLYYSQLSRYFDLFPQEQMLVLLYDDFAADPRSAVHYIFEFIGIDPGFEPRLHLVYGASGAPTSCLANRLLFKDNILRKTARLVMPRGFKARLAAALKRRFLTKISVDPATRAYLADYYDDDVTRLSVLLSRDLSGWLKEPLVR